MSYFSKFPKTSYDFFDATKLSTIPDLFRQVKLVERRLDNISVYQKYFIIGSRPDQVSYELYESPDFYWTFMLVNSNLRSAMNKWPLQDLVLGDFINEKYIGSTLTPHRLSGDANDFNSINDMFSIGSTLVGSTSGATATITARHTTLNQIVFTYDTDAVFLEGTDTFTATSPTGGVSQLLNTQYNIRTYPNSPHHYEDGNGVTIYNQDNLELTQNITTNTEYETEVNEGYKEIRVIKPRYIQSFSSEIRKLINE
jgi:hypothetical protein